MSKAKLRVRENGNSVKPYVDNAKDEVAQAIAEMEADRKVVDDELEQLMAEGPDDSCEEWPEDEMA